MTMVFEENEPEVDEQEDEQEELQLSGDEVVSNAGAGDESFPNDN